MSGMELVLAAMRKHAAVPIRIKYAQEPLSGLPWLYLCTGKDNHDPLCLICKHNRDRKCQNSRAETSDSPSLSTYVEQ